MVRILDSEAVRGLVDLGELLDVVATAFERQGAGAVERPSRPHYPVGIGLDESAPEEPMGTGLVMPAYIHGEEHFVTKLVSVHEDNPARNLPTIHAQVAVNDAETGVPVAYMDGGYVTAARTSCIGGLSARALTSGPLTVGIVGAGTQARWQARAIAEATTVDAIRFYDLDEERLADAVAELDAELAAGVEAADDARAAVTGADMVVTATTSPEPVFPGEALEPGTVVVGIGAYTADMQEIDPTTFERAARVFADVPEEVAEIGDVTGASLTEADLIPFSEMLHGNVGRESSEDILVVESVGSAVMDAAAASYIVEQAEAEEVGTEVDL